VSRLARLLPLVFLALLIAGTCDRVLYARLHDDSTARQPVFVIGSNPDCSGRVPVYAASVTGVAWDSTGRADTIRSWRTFWEVRVDSGRKWVPLSELRYGAVPFYTHSIAGPDSLLSGYVYACNIRCYGLSPTVYFEIVPDRAGRPVIRPLTSEQFLHRVKRT
jgi:hypothetical protein